MLKKLKTLSNMRCCAVACEKKVEGKMKERIFVELNAIFLYSNILYSLGQLVYIINYIIINYLYIFAFYCFELLEFYAYILH